jgi:hypothetical protein
MPKSLKKSPKVTAPEGTNILKFGTEDFKKLSPMEEMQLNEQQRLKRLKDLGIKDNSFRQMVEAPETIKNPQLKQYAENWRKSFDSHIEKEKNFKIPEVEKNLRQSELARTHTGYKDWASGAPTTQEQSKSFYERLAKEAAKDDTVRDIDLNKYQTQKAADAKLARSQALKRILGAAGKGLSAAGKIAAPIGGIMGLYGDDIAPEGEEFEMPRKSRK